MTRLLLACAIATLLFGQPLLAADEPQRPNILFLFADDLSYEGIRSAGLTDIDTPNLDRLAKQGTQFTHAYNMGSWSGAVCVASRTMLITGRDLWRAEAIYNTTDQLRQRGELWPQLLSKAGYKTYMTGKWHIRAKVEEAFDVTAHVRAGMPNTVASAYNRPLANQTDKWSPSDESLGGFWQGGTHWSVVGADDAIQFLNDDRQPNEPFFMYVAFNAAHDPRQSPQEYVDRYPLERIEVPENYLTLYPHKDAIGCGPGLRDEKLAPFPRTEHAIQVHRQEYYALIEHMDAQIGRILDSLEKSGQADNTYIFFTADHGLAVGHHGLLGKQNMYDHSLRVPFIAAGPKVPAGKTNDAKIYLQDVMPTTLELAGIEIPESVNFHSLMPLMTGKTSESPYESIMGAYLDLQRAIIHDNWKLIVYPKAGVQRLYNLSADPQEMNDLAGQPEHAARQRELFTRLMALQESLNDKLELQPAE